MIEGRPTGLFRINGRGRRHTLAVMAALGFALALSGGASRYDEWQQTAVRLAAIAAAVALSWFRSPAIQRGPLLAILALYLLPALQLVPMPAEWWAELPGHDVYGRIALETGHFDWRPLSLTPDLTMDALLSLLPATAACIGALQLDGRGRTRLAQGIVVIAISSALLGLAQLGAAGTALHLYQQSNPDAPVGLFANRNHQAVFQACSLPLIGALAARALREARDPKIVLAMGLGATLLLLMTAALTGSRMGLLLALVGLAGAVLCFRAGGGRLPFSRRARRGAAAAMAGGLLLAAVAAWQGGAIQRLAVTDSASETRLAALPALIETARSFMPLGAGFGSFDPVYRRFEPDVLLSTVYLNEAHDEPLQLAIEGGVPAILLLALFLIWWGRSATRIVRGVGGVRRRGLGLAAATVTAQLMLSSLVDYPLRTPLLGALFLVMCVEMMRAAAVETEATAHA